MLSRQQVMQIAFAAKNPVLTARIMRDYRRKQRVRVPKLQGRLEHCPFNIRKTPDGWRANGYIQPLSSQYVAVIYYNNSGMVHRDGGPAIDHEKYHAWFKNGSLGLSVIFSQGRWTCGRV
jgi:hypothetical protein